MRKSTISSGSKTEAKHSPGFRSVSWNGVDYKLTRNQAACVRVLWEAWENKTPDIGWEKIRELADVESDRIVDVFKSLQEWRKMIAPGRKGAYRLTEPDKK